MGTLVGVSSTVGQGNAIEGSIPPLIAYGISAANAGDTITASFSGAVSGSATLGVTISIDGVAAVPISSEIIGSTIVYTMDTPLTGFQPGTELDWVYDSGPGTLTGATGDLEDSTRTYTTPVIISSILFSAGWTGAVNCGA